MVIITLLTEFSKISTLWDLENYLFPKENKLIYIFNDLDNNMSNFYTGMDLGNGFIQLYNFSNEYNIL